MAAPSRKALAVGLRNDVRVVTDQSRPLTLKSTRRLAPIDASVDINGDVELVYFDLETTGLARTSHITQIAAWRDTSDTQIFSRYVKPEIPIGARAQEVTGITYDASTDQMYKHDAPVASVGIKTAMSEFLDYLGGSAMVVLLAHNAKRFDGPILMSAAVNTEMVSSLQKIVLGFVDTLPVLRSVHPDLRSYTLAQLCEYFDLAVEGTSSPRQSSEADQKSSPDSPVRLHDASDDVRALQAVMTQPSAMMTSSGLCRQILSRNSFTVKYVLDSLARSQQKPRYQRSWEPLQD